ncbi:hypothetical protein C1645_734887 [Glomus cerebriforme]|uniref:Uncharacterized protein n=1 Tax=Glomus cerebriforme TaxID=658196 RepID=A0A397TBH6_9GLOM|nr:hypothetical protein C1645_734887 [Glomus cerebriforme]
MSREVWIEVIGAIDFELLMELKAMSDSNSIKVVLALDRLAGIGRWPFGHFSRPNWPKKFLAVAKCQYCIKVKNKGRNLWIFILLMIIVSGICTVTFLELSGREPSDSRD